MSTGKSHREQGLLKEGWAKRFFASGSRLQETVELYESMGLEVHLEPVRAEDLGCSECHLPGSLETIENCYVIYTRPGENTEEKRSPNTYRQEEELW